eukprot:4355441-Pleurochrysis_carterae.AAC.1
MGVVLRACSSLRLSREPERLRTDKLECTRSNEKLTVLDIDPSWHREAGVSCMVEAKRRTSEAWHDRRVANDLAVTGALAAAALHVAARRRTGLVLEDKMNGIGSKLRLHQSYYRLSRRLSHPKPPHFSLFAKPLTPLDHATESMLKSNQLLWPFALVC